MRTRIRAVIAFFGIVVTVLLIAAPAFAQEAEPQYASKFDKEPSRGLAAFSPRRHFG